MTSAPSYTPSELMAVNAARLLADGEVVFVGVGLPNLACNLALRTHAPGLTLIYEAGVIGARPERLPLSIGDPALVTGASAIASMYDVFALYLQRGLVDVGFLGGAQISRIGDINATVIGDYAHPRARLPGSGGSMEIAAWARKCFIITPHQKRRFPEKVDFQTSLGHGPARRALPGRGPQAVVTDLGLLRPAPAGELVLAALHPGATVEQARANTGWPLRAAPDLTITAPPTPDELALLRALDPDRIYLK